MARHIDRQELATVIRNLQGITDEQKSALLELLNEKKKYGLVWENHQENAEDLLREQIPVLKEVTERRIISEDKDAPNHIIIEGDNLHALTSLCYTHEGKIDVIYIDPPYNTGNKDFVYNDSYVDAEDGYRHSKWLSFMEKRLRIAHRLLSDKGVIFISIDDNEQANLKLLCDEVFGEYNFRNTIIDRRRTKTLNIQFANNGLKTMNVGAEYVLVYAAPGFLFKEMKALKKDSVSKGTWNVFWSNADRPTMRYELLGFTPSSGQWRWSKELAIEAVNSYNEYVNKHSSISLEEYWEQTGKVKKFIRRIPNGLGKNGGVQYWVGPSDTYLRTSNWTDIEVSQIHKDFDLNFDNPKNVELIKEILKASFLETHCVLDFFAGSGTTMHATMQLNAEDGGHRQCILVTNNENNICEEVTYERNCRVINGYTTPKGVEVEGLHNNNLRYYRTEFVPREKSNANKRSLVYAATDLLCIKENIYDEAAVTIQGRTVRKKFIRRFVDGDREMMVIYEPQLISRIVEELKVRDVKYPILVYVFCDGQYAYTDDFRDVLDKVNLCAVPDAIYQAYSKVLPPRKPLEDFAVGASEEEIREALNDADNYSYKSDETGEL